MLLLLLLDGIVVLFCCALCQFLNFDYGLASPAFRASAVPPVRVDVT